MAKNNKSELDEVIDAMPVATFKNVHGEKFRIHRLGSFDLISIYSDDELESLGRAFIKLAQKARKNND